MKVQNDKSLKRKRRKEMGTKEFEEVEISLAMMGVDVTITQRTISKLLGVTNTRKFIFNTKLRSLKVDAIKTSLFELYEDTCSSSYFENIKNMKTNFKLLFKILIGSLIPREGNTYQISWDHRHFTFYLVNEDKINLPSYIFHHFCEAIKESKKHNKKNVPYVRLLSKLFYQSRLIDALKTVYDNKDLEEIHGNILPAFFLANMKLLKKSEVVVSKEPLRIRWAKTDYLEDYIVITKHKNPDVIRIC